MTLQNGFDDIVILRSGSFTSYAISHLENLKISINDFQFENGHIGLVTIHTRPTNHLYTRKLSATDNRESLFTTKELIRRYEHHPGNFQSVIKDNTVSNEERVFCIEKYEESYLFPSFVALLSKNFSKMCILGNLHDDKTCLSALIELPEEYDSDRLYLVFFKLVKVNAREINMLIETAYTVDSVHKKAELLTSRQYADSRKPFAVLIKNTLAGRKPFEGKKISKAKRKQQKHKKRKNPTK